jgi:hypothetical protein
MRFGARKWPTTPAMGMALLGLCAGATPVHAGVYRIVQSTADQITVIDPAAIDGAPDAAVRKAWSVTVQRNLVTGGAPGYVRTLNEYDCANSLVRWRTFSAYSRFGALVMTKANSDGQWNPVAHGGSSEGALRLVCGSADTGGVIAAKSIGQLVLSLMASWDPVPAQAPAQAPSQKPAAAGDKPAPRR